MWAWHMTKFEEKITILYWSREPFTISPNNWLNTSQVNSSIDKLLVVKIKHHKRHVSVHYLASADSNWISTDYSIPWLYCRGGTWTNAHCLIMLWFLRQDSTLCKKNITHYKLINEDNWKDLRDHSKEGKWIFTLDFSWSPLGNLHDFAISDLMKWFLNPRSKGQNWHWSCRKAHITPTYKWVVIITN